MQKLRIGREIVSSDIRRLFVILIILVCESHLCGLYADQIIYDDALENGWENWGWVPLNLANTSPVHSGGDSISLNFSAAWDGFQIVNPSALDDTFFTNISFWLNGGTNGGQKLQVYGLLDVGGAVTAQGARVPLTPLPTNGWQLYVVSLASMGVANQTNFSGFVLQDATGSAQPAFYMDDVALVARYLTNPVSQGTNPPISILVNAQSNRLAISPMIYGVAFATSNQLLDLNFTMNRLGGNEETRYNWQTNAHNLDADWYFESTPDSSPTPGASADAFIANSFAGGAQPMITIPMIGWAPRLGTNRAIIPSYSVAKYGAQTAADPNLPDAGNGISMTTGQPITTNNPNDANMPVDVAFEQGYVQHLMGHWSSSTNGGVRFFIMDNEHSIWFQTHQDIHPAGPTMQEIWGRMLTNALMVKSNDPNAMVAGPEEWGWAGYLYSGYDQQWSAQHNDYDPADFPDRGSNGGWDYAPWLLNQFHQYDLTNHQRLLDYFTLHCYPQETGANGGVSGNAADPATELLRNQSTRQFWDANYVDPSWIDTVIDLIPRMKNWVATWYPGTKIGITEYQWGAEASDNGATAQADILGIFGRQGLDLATRLGVPTGGTPTYLAMKMYRNYDGSNSIFGDTSILTTVPNPDDLSAFGAVRSGDGALTLMVINKDITNASPFNAVITNFNATGPARRWQMSAAVIYPLSSLTMTNGVLSDTVPFQSITLYVLPGLLPFSLQKAAGNYPPGQVGLQLNGQSGLTYILQSSTDLVHWTPLSTNQLVGDSLPFVVSTTTSGAKFYRAQFSQ
jgi:hypothetical protein